MDKRVRKKETKSMAVPRDSHKLKILKISLERKRGVLKRIVSVAIADRSRIIRGWKPRPVSEPTPFPLL